MEFSQLLNLILHIDKSLGDLLVNYGALVYALLFGIVFAETGLVIFPFLPGDTLLFMGGAFCATGAMNAPLLTFLLVTAATTGNTVNYFVGRAIGQQAYTRNYRWLDRTALEKTHAFFEKHGARTVVLARFVPIVRTFAPVVAGVSGMDYRTFVRFNVVGGLLWGVGVPLLGYFLGQIEFVKHNIEAAILVVVAVSVLPVVLEFVKHRRNRAH